MMIISYGAMLSYLMIIKDTFSTILGINETDILERRCILLIISIIPLLLSCQRDMADLAITSKMNVVLDFIMVLLVVYLAKLTPTKILNKLGLTDYNDDYDDDMYVGEYAGEYHGNENSPTTTIMKSDYYNDTNNNSSFIQSPGIIPIPSSSSSSSYEYELSSESSSSFSNNNSIFQIQYKTIFIGLGVLSFAFVCQHSAFIIAGSLTKPTKDRWSKVTKLGVYSAVSLALLMGICGYLGFSTASTNNEEDDGYQSHQRISGNILNSLPTDSTIANIARGLLGITMLFVYPMESFVARHSCVVLFFHGRQAHDGDDASVLNRRSRRITLTVVLYLLAVIPAALFNDLGNVLAITGSIGGSCLSYIGPGIVYIGIHGGRLLELNDAYFGNNTINNGVMIQSLFKTMLWYVIGMPIWIKFATIGKHHLTNHISDMALKSPHPIRIGNVRFVRAKVHGNQRYTRVVMLQKSQQNNNINVITNKNIEYRRSNSLSSSPSTNTTTNISTNGDDQHNRHRHQNNHHDVETKPLHADSLPKLSKDNDSYKVQTMKDGAIVALPASAFFTTTTTTTTTQRGQQHQQQMLNNDNDDDTEKQNYQSVIDKEEEDEIVDDDDLALEDDPQRDPPSAVDFLIAISYVIFGVIALAAGLMSIFFG
jgi:amino acid permease